MKRARKAARIILSGVAIGAVTLLLCACSLNAGQSNELPQDLKSSQGVQSQRTDYSFVNHITGDSNVIIQTFDPGELSFDASTQAEADNNQRGGSASADSNANSGSLSVPISGL